MSHPKEDHTLSDKDQPGHLTKPYYDNATELLGLISAITLRPGQRLVLDLGGMEFCDSSGLSALIAAHNHAHAAQADFALASVPAHTLRTLRIVGLDQLFPICPDSDAAPLPEDVVCSPRSDATTWP
ncbi:STAS domain-containing protein [Streptomyces sp. M2CJ-2]|uniref:STAS domain-containing protein n=1 Tax=Streptomyces sp. M2CJ-2 TaxID=2803948 RepID=UPI001925ADE0|nr:STAS domain-containing protein [Streptomyces sp. M2CJ-2]MBL3671001.1 STAS domain-containing protein [Streptomyces sp. M2CJ-2]